MLSMRDGINDEKVGLRFQILKFLLILLPLMYCLLFIVYGIANTDRLIGTVACFSPYTAGKGASVKF